MRYLPCYLFAIFFAASSSIAAEESSFLLKPELSEGDTSAVKVKLEIGGDRIVIDESGAEKKLPLTVMGDIRYFEKLLSWSTDPAGLVCSQREYQIARAEIQVDKSGIVPELPSDKKSIKAEVHQGRAVLSGVPSPLTREQYDLVNTVGNSLALNQLLPQKKLAEGDSWQHTFESMSALLGMDHLAVCEVNSVVTGCVERQVQIRLAGTVHGTVDGAPTEMELRGAYLFHEDHKRITKFNLAIKESRNSSPINPGLDVVAKVFITIIPTTSNLPKSFNKVASKPSQPLTTAMRYEAPEGSFQFLHDRIWYVTAEEREYVLLRALQDGNLTANCNIITLPARSEGRETTLHEFERDVRQSLGDNLETVTASTKWTTKQGNECLGVVAQGTVKNVPIEWRYYLVTSPNLPRVSLGVTVEQSQIEKFNDADRQIVESLELLPKPTTAARQTSKVTR